MLQYFTNLLHKYEAEHKTYWPPALHCSPRPELVSVKSSRHKHLREPFTLLHSCGQLWPHEAHSSISETDYTLSHFWFHFLLYARTELFSLEVSHTLQVKIFVLVKIPLGQYSTFNTPLHDFLSMSEIANPSLQWHTYPPPLRSVQLCSHPPLSLVQEAPLALSGMICAFFEVCCTRDVRYKHRSGDVEVISWNNLFCSLTTPNFIRHITAVINIITDTSTIHALLVRTLELVTLAGSRQSCTWEENECALMSNQNSVNPSYFIPISSRKISQNYNCASRMKISSGTAQWWTVLQLQTSVQDHLQTVWLFSSEPSPQLSTLSHMRQRGIQMKLLHRNLESSGQSMDWQTAAVSSEPSPQSSSPSHLHSRATQICWRNNYTVQYISLSFHTDLIENQVYLLLFHRRAKYVRCWCTGTDLPDRTCR